MNTESLRITLVQEGPQHAVPEILWRVTYCGYVENPTTWQEIEYDGEAEFRVEYVTGTWNNVSQALEKAQAWAIGSGFKARTPKPIGGNTFEIKLVRP